MYDFLVGFSINKEETIFLQSSKRKESKVTLFDLPRTVAGSSFNVALTLRELGAKVRLLCTVGRDNHADDISDKLTEDGLDHFQLRVRVGTSRTIVLVPEDNPKDAVQYCYKPSFDERLIPQALLQIREQMDACQPKYAVATGVRYCDIPLVKKMFETGSKRVLNLNIELARRLDLIVEADLLNGVDKLVLNHEEAAVLLDKEPADFTKDDVVLLGKKFSMVKEVIVTWNSHGSFWFNLSLGKLYHQPSLARKVIDPTGAGDAYLAGFLCKRLAGSTIEESMLYGSIAAAVKVTKVGGSNVPQKNEIKQFLKII